MAQTGELQTGWKCPGCGRCFSPSTSQCAYCGPSAAPNPYWPPTQWVPCPHTGRYYETSAGRVCMECGQHIPMYGGYETTWLRATLPSTTHT